MKYTLKIYVIAFKPSTSLLIDLQLMADLQKTNILIVADIDNKL